MAHTHSVPDLSGLTAVVTGANGGLGLQTARVLAAKGAHVVMAVRNQDKAARAVEEIRAETPVASLELVELDLASQASVSKAGRADPGGSRPDRHPGQQRRADGTTTSAWACSASSSGPGCVHRA
jgi:nucleoside-diphosphate-sugar epimerase